MSEYLPYSEKHSIVEAQVVLLFAGDFDQTQIENAKRAAESTLGEELPKFAEIVQGSVRFDVTNRDEPVQTGPLSSNLTGFELSRIKSNGQPARILRLTNDQVLVSVLDYEAWELTCQAVIRYVEAILWPLTLAGNPVLAVGLRFNDRYTFEGAHQAATAGLLFIDGNGYMATQCFAAGPTWHCNTGWFASHNAGRVLHNLNVASAVADGSSAATVEHTATLYLSTPRQSLGALLSPTNTDTGFIRVLDSLHDDNKDILRAMLKPEMLGRIGLNE